MPELRITNHSPFQSAISDPAKGSVAVLPAGETVEVDVSAGVMHRIKDQLKNLRARKLDEGGDAFTITILDALVDENDIGGQDAAEVWVSPDGDDSNPGTRSAPLASIQLAVNQLKEHGPGVYKTVYLQTSASMTETAFSKWVLDETVVINQSRFTIKSDRSIVDMYQELQVDANPVFLVTDLTESAAREFLAAGGPSYTYNDADGAYSYTGADLAGLDVEAELIERIQFEYIRVNQDADSFGIACVSSQQGWQKGIRRVRFKNCDVTNFGGGESLFAKGVGNAWLVDSSFTHNVIMDDSYDFHIAGTSTNTRTNWPFLGELIINGDGSIVGASHAIKAWSPSTCVSAIKTAGSFDNDLINVSVGGLVSNRGGGVLAGDAQLGDGERPVVYGGKRVEADEFKVLDTASMHVLHFKAHDLTKSSTGAMTLQNAHIYNNATISAGTSNVIKGGVIEGNLTVSGSANIDLSGVIVKGNVDLTNAGTVTWKGGHFEGTLTDPSSKLGAVSAGDYLYV